MNIIAYNNNLASQYRFMRKQVLDNKDPVLEEVQKCLGTFDFAATFERDTETIETLKAIPGIVAFTCKISKGDKIIGIGRGSSVINRTNRFVERSVHSAFNSSLVDGVIRATKILDSFHPDANSKTQGVDVELEGITDKQKSYLFELIRGNVANEVEIKEWKSKIDGLTKDEASEAIQSLKR